MMLSILDGHNESRNNAIKNTQLINLLVSNNSLIPSPGYIKFIENDGDKIRGQSNVSSLKGVVYVLDDSLFKIVDDVKQELLREGVIGSGFVKIVENYSGKIAILTDGSVLIYTISTNILTTLDTGNKEVIDIDYQDSRFFYLFIDNTFKISEVNDSVIFEDFTGIISGKAQALKSFSRQLWVFSTNTIDVYYETGAIPLVYEKSNTLGMSYGCIAPRSIAENFGYIAFLGSNGFSSLFIAISSGGTPTVPSDENIDFLLDQVKNPEKAIGYIYQVDGHTLYQVYFPDEDFGIIYDMYSKRFTKIMSRNIVNDVITYKNTYLAFLDNDTTIYKYGLDNYSEDGNVVERYVIPRMIDNGEKPQSINFLSIATETGMSSNGYCELLISKDRGETYKPYETKKVATIGKYGYFLRFRYLGSAYFWSFLVRFVVDGKFAIKYMKIQ